MTERWLEDRLKPYVDRKEVAVLAPGTDLICWEEYCFSNPKDVLERNITTSIEKEGLYVGDVVIWQPAPPSGPRRRILEGPRRPPSVNGTVGATGEEEREEGTIATRATDDAGRGHGGYCRYRHCPKTRFVFSEIHPVMLFAWC